MQFSDKIFKRFFYHLNFLCQLQIEFCILRIESILIRDRRRCNLNHTHHKPTFIIRGYNTFLIILVPSCQMKIFDERLVRIRDPILNLKFKSNIIKRNMKD